MSWLECIKRSVDEWNSAEVVIDRRYSFPECTISGRAEDRTLVLLTQELTDIITSMRPAYSWLAEKRNLIGHFTFGLFLGAPVVNALVFFTASSSSSKGPTHDSPAIKALSVVVIFAWISVCFTAPWLIEKISTWLYPSAVILFGDEIQEAQRKENNRTLFVGGVVLAFIVSVVASIVVSHI